MRNLKIILVLVVMIGAGALLSARGSLPPPTGETPSAVRRQPSFPIYPAGIFGPAAEVEPDTPEYWLQLAVLYQQAAEYDKAEEAYRQLLTTEEPDEAVYFNLGLVLLEQGHLDEAAEMMAQAVAAAPYPDRALYALANVYSRQGLYDEAVDVYLEALEYLPWSGDIWLDLGHAYAATGQNEEATAAYLKAAAFLPELNDTVSQLITQLQ